MRERDIPPDHPGPFVAVFVLSEREVYIYGPYATFGEAKAKARTLSSDPDEGYVGILRPDSEGVN